jgi:arylsulfatase A
MISSKPIHLLALMTPALAIQSCSEPAYRQDGKPNFIIIFTDDLGYGDLGCFGATDIKTPNIDRLAGEGIKFTSFYSASHICSPSRAGLLTGRYPQRMGIHGVFHPDSFTGLPEDEITIPHLLAPAGYTSAMIGKWHLGHLYQYLPLQRGFDEHFGVPYSNDMADFHYFRGNKIEERNVDQRYLTRRLTEESLDFIERNSNRPFFLYLAHPMPHVPLYVSEEFEGSSQRGLYGDVIQELDWSVGKIIGKLEEEALLNNTLIVFTSDNGPWLVMRDHGGSSGPLREGKQYTFEGGMRVPTVAMWKGRIPEGIVYDDIVTMMDLFPTFAAIAGLDVPTGRPLDGIDITPVLTGKIDNQYREFLYFDHHRLEAFRAGDWKVKLEYEGFSGARWKKAVAPHPLSLFNLREDPGERVNLAGRYTDRLDEMLKKMDSAYKALGDLPPPLRIRSQADTYHYDYLTEKYGPEFYIFDN